MSTAPDTGAGGGVDGGGTPDAGAGEVPAWPTSTYRVQLSPDFPFAAAGAAVPYLASLGVSHLQLSPVLEAVPGSAHGYDVVAHDRVREELGGEAGLRALSAAARGHGMGIVLDWVPNHMAVPAPERLNAPLWDVLRHGRGSAFAGWFDVAWDAGGGRLLLPVLGGEPADVMDELSVQGDELRYYAHAFPLRPGTEDLALPALLDAQHYRLAHWRRAATELNYRRFFTVSELIGVRVEEEDVFAATHAVAARLLADGVAHGLRIDHPDGLADPEGYLERLRAASGGAWTVVEKILAPGERLPAGWRCAGTTGYDALRHVDGLFTDPAGLRELADGYREFTGAADDLGGVWGPTALRAAHRVLDGELTAEVDRLARAAATARPDVPAPALRAALRAVLARMPVYRPYAGDARSAQVLEAVAAEAVAAGGAPEGAVAAVRDLALGCGEAADRGAAGDVAVRFAQVAAAAHAKAAEDCAYYRYVPLLSANEVGGRPEAPGVTPEEFHAFCAERQARWPLGGNVLSTHDTKRSADVRARTAALSQAPGAWAALLAGVAARPDGRGPDRHTAHLVWQTAFGLEERCPERLTAAVLKAVREAGLRTAWTDGDAAYDPDYERAVEAFVRSGPCGEAGGALDALGGRLAPHVDASALGAALLHLTMPGVPDVYQGTEDRSLTLVDPDNRRPVALGAAEPVWPLKVALTGLALRLRREEPEAFGPAGAYTPLAVSGPAAGHVVAFARGGRAVTAVTRLSLRLAEAGGWRGSTLALPPGDWRDALTGRTLRGEVPAADVFAAHPVALLRAG